MTGSGIQLPEGAWIRTLRRKVLCWFDRSARELPWRASKTAYHVWVSEIMLQQTQVATVLEFYPRFVARFPTIQVLAEADSGAVLRCWEGLGYYRRASQMHAAARQIVQYHDGQFPADIEQARALPGIGRYTAGAILSIAMEQRHPILEANTTRLHCRLLAYAGAPNRAAGQRLLWSFAERLLPRRRVGDFNQALMELGSVICTPRQPACVRCPVATLCPTHARGLQCRIPRVKKRAGAVSLHEAAVVIQRAGHVLIHRCAPGQRWAGLWDYPRFEVEPAQPADLAPHLKRRVKELTGLTISAPRHLATLHHTVTRFRISLSCHAATCRRATLDKNGWQWVRITDLDDYPLSVTGRRISQLLAAS